MRSGSSQRIIPVLYEDESFIVFDKPAGVLVIPAPGEKKQTLVDIVNRQRAPAQGWKLHPCHRLDRETSGAIIFAKGKGQQQAMMALFHRQAVRKQYIAFVHGKLRQRQGELRSAIRDLDQIKFRRGASAKPSVTRYRVIEERGSFSVVEVTPVTGRTNQIRIQFAEIGHPLLGERKYARGKDHQLRFRRVALHAQTLEWEHPVSHKKINITAKLHPDMEEFIARNRN